MFSQHIGDGASANLEAQITQRAQYSCVTPTRILLYHAQNKGYDFILGSWAAPGPRRCT